jgi:hypothetical protein
VIGYKSYIVTTLNRKTVQRGERGVYTREATSQPSS